MVDIGQVNSFFFFFYVGVQVFKVQTSRAGGAQLLTNELSGIHIPLSHVMPWTDINMLFRKSQFKSSIRSPVWLKWVPKSW